MDTAFIDSFERTIASGEKETVTVSISTYFRIVSTEGKTVLIELDDKNQFSAFGGFAYETPFSMGSDDELEQETFRKIRITNPNGSAVTVKILHGNGKIYDKTLSVASEFRTETRAPAPDALEDGEVLIAASASVKIASSGSENEQIYISIVNGEAPTVPLLIRGSGSTVANGAGIPIINVNEPLPLRCSGDIYCFNPNGGAIKISVSRFFF